MAEDFPKPLVVVLELVLWVKSWQSGDGYNTRMELLIEWSIRTGWKFSLLQLWLPFTIVDYWQREHCEKCSENLDRLPSEKFGTERMQTDLGSRRK